MNAQNALLIGNSDGIGLAITRKLLAAGWSVAGISRSPLPPGITPTHQRIADVADPGYPALVEKVLEEAGTPDVCIYCVGIADDLDFDNLATEAQVVRVNLLGAVLTFEKVLPHLLARGRGQIVALSSLADAVMIPDAPSYSASKAGLSNYLGSLALKLKPRGITITNVRFGFVDTKMAKSDAKPMVLSVEKAADHVIRCIDRRPLRLTTPKLAGFVLHLHGCWQTFRLWIGR